MAGADMAVEYNLISTAAQLHRSFRRRARTSTTQTGYEADRTTITTERHRLHFPPTRVAQPSANCRQLPRGHRLQLVASVTEHAVESVGRVWRPSSRRPRRCLSPAEAGGCLGGPLGGPPDQRGGGMGGDRERTPWSKQIQRGCAPGGTSGAPSEASPGIAAADESGSRARGGDGGGRGGLLSMAVRTPPDGPPLPAQIIIHGNYVISVGMESSLLCSANRK